MKVPNLEKVVIENMNNIEIIWSNQFVEHSILKLKSLEVNECKKLKSLFTWNVCRKLSCLVTLEIRSCDSLEEICCPMVINSVERTSIESKELRTTLISFEKLKCMEVSKCQNLKYMFEKEIVEEKETHTATMELVFPILDELKLYKLPRLRAFYPNEQTVHMPVLKNLILKKCCTPETPEEDHRMQQLLAVGKVCISSSICMLTFIFICDVICLLSGLSTLGDIEYVSERSHDDVGTGTSVSELHNS